VSIYLPFKKLTPWQQGVFAAALVERMLPNFSLYNETSGCGDMALLRNQLDLVWQRLAKKSVKINFEVQLEKLEGQVPEVNDDDAFGVYAALDVCMALTSLLQGMADKSQESFEQVSKLSYANTSAYVELLLLEQGAEQISEAMLKDHPLLQWEKDSQFELFDLVKALPENELSCDRN
jgi:uncharacterized protein YjaG (DUF416 family)